MTVAERLVTEAERADLVALLLADGGRCAWCGGDMGDSRLTYVCDACVEQAEAAA